MHRLNLSADELILRLLEISKSEPVCILDSCGVGHLGSHLLIAGVRPSEVHEITNDDPSETLTFLDEKLSSEKAAIFTLSYDLGLKLEHIHSRHETTEEPDVFLALFDALIVHYYDTGETHLIGDLSVFDDIEKLLRSVPFERDQGGTPNATFASNFTHDTYLDSIDDIKERIRRGDTYQTNLTQRLTVSLSPATFPQAIFHNLRRDNPAPFAAFIQRKDSTVISASPERFFRVEGDAITTSPIKGTRPRGTNASEDEALKNELLSSEKDIAENTMIVDLLRNDLGRVCKYGSVRVEKLCDLEEHPTLFHLVSTISGKLRTYTTFSETLQALFPCGSITGAPKISTMRIIDELEPDSRGLSMGAIGISIPGPKFDVPNSPSLDLSVAIRTMVIRDDKAVFNVGGGIVIDSDPESEYEESLLKAKALLEAIRPFDGGFPLL
ncbi:MAG: aminodeoxychorismate synthase component I [Acidobacteriota bacterium]